MQLEDGAGSLGTDGPEEAVLHRLGLVLTVDNQQNPLGLHDGADAHGVGVGGHVVPGGEEPGVGVDGGLGQSNLVGALDKSVGGLIEADVAVGAKAQQLQVSAAEGVDDGIVAGALTGGIRVHAVGDVAVGLIDVHMVKQVGAHEVGIALVMVLGQAHILVQVDGLDLREVQVAGLILGNQLLIGAHRAAAGSQAQHTVGLQINLGGDDVGGLPAHILIVLGANQSHGWLPLSNPCVFYGFHSATIA